MMVPIFVSAGRKRVRMFPTENVVRERPKLEAFHRQESMESISSFISGPGDEDPDLSEVCLVGGDLVEFNAKRIGSGVRKLDISFNVIQRLKGIEISADTLEEIIVDNNQLKRIEFMLNFPKLHTLSLNKNLVSDLAYLVSALKHYAPNLRHLSLLGNPACPDKLTVDEVDESDYQQYRLYIIHHLPALRFLDSRPVTQFELFESQRSLHREIHFYQQCSPLPGQKKTSVPRFKNVVFSATGIAGMGEEKGDNKSIYGKRRFKYVGKNSEGNRFIKDTDL